MKPRIKGTLTIIRPAGKTAYDRQWNWHIDIGTMNTGVRITGNHTYTTPGKARTGARLWAARMGIVIG